MGSHLGFRDFVVLLRDVIIVVLLRHVVVVILLHYVVVSFRYDVLFFICLLVALIYMNDSDEQNIYDQR